jgi:hypothetical protein
MRAIAFGSQITLVITYFGRTFGVELCRNPDLILEDARRGSAKGLNKRGNAPSHLAPALLPCYVIKTLNTYPCRLEQHETTSLLCQYKETSWLSVQHWGVYHHPTRSTAVVVSPRFDLHRACCTIGTDPPTLSQPTARLAHTTGVKRKVGLVQKLITVRLCTVAPALRRPILPTISFAA